MVRGRGPTQTGRILRSESTECPICGKFMSHLRQHLTARHKVGNFAEKCLLMNWSSGRGKLSCRVCDKVGLSRLDKHLVDLHQLPPNEVEEQMLLQLVVVKLGELRQQGPLARCLITAQATSSATLASPSPGNTHSHDTETPATPRPVRESMAKEHHAAPPSPSIPTNTLQDAWPRFDAQRVPGANETQRGGEVGVVKCQVAKVPVISLRTALYCP
ncbi:unnamed protein product [Gadus morhua 'NCC']